MSDDITKTPPQHDPAIQVAATEAVAKAEAAATRRRWINLGEFIAVAGLLIAGGSLYLNWSDHRADQADKRVAAVKAQRDSSRFDVRAVPAANGTALLLQHDDRHPIRDATVTFPSELGIGSKDTVGDTIERGWFEHEVLKATDGAMEKKTGRLPVLIALTYWDGDTPRTTRGIYDIGWKAEGGFPFGRSLKLESLRLHELGGTQARLDAVWASVKPKPKS
ncbi:hypothetical protein J2X47_003006 [Sphingomonas sp. BE270]|jgi:hypothetical protein|uniref:hypothetical protein n=1 Tax=unclassified Sphingomonas TaxID=196159 RepID=UPI00068D6BF3|nr:MULTISPECIES: hypothetical protein [unclassified Sphingomonas]MDR6849563.1 hypothetical protein [Sphingomonas sp. BE137]MDR7258816.1 hypothetical protein [Sphingomonas sp. BE270]